MSRVPVARAFCRRLSSELEKKTMRILLLNPETGLYFESLNSWTANPQTAQDFRNSRQAAMFAQELSQNHLEIFLDFGDEEYNVALPVEARLQYP